MPKWIGAAGCCVNANGQLLMIRGKDDNVWSVPSGGLEPSESLEECCIREVWEETGYKVEIIHHLTTKAGKWGNWEAEVHYFLVRMIGGSKKIQDPDGLIGDIDWKSRTEINGLQLQYPEDRELMQELLAGADVG